MPDPKPLAEIAREAVIGDCECHRDAADPCYYCQMVERVDAALRAVVRECQAIAEEYASGCEKDGKWFDGEAKRRFEQRRLGALHVAAAIGQRAGEEA